MWSPRIPGRWNHVNVESENTWETEPRQCRVREYLGDGTTSMWSPRIPGRRNHVNVESENTWEMEPRQCGVREYLHRSYRSFSEIIYKLFGRSLRQCQYTGHGSPEPTGFETGKAREDSIVLIEFNFEGTALKRTRSPGTRRDHQIQWNVHMTRSNSEYEGDRVVETWSPGISSGSH